MVPLLFILSVSLLVSQYQAEKVYYELEDAEHHFEEFIATYNKQYLTEEEKNYRFNIFKENLIKINKDNTRGHAVYGITNLSDLSDEEFKRFHTGLTLNGRANDDHSCTLGVLSGEVSAPDTWDWTQKGVVTPVKDQGYTCGSCWAFGTTGHLEGQYAIKHKKLISLSEQQLIDCDMLDNNCDGGLTVRAFTWLSNNNGSMTEDDYPYEGILSACRHDPSKAVVQVTGCHYYNITETELKELLVTVGPIAISIDGSQVSQNYKGNIFHCEEEYYIDHVVLLTGYGIDGDIPYWIVKNSWGPHWGDNGYFRLAMGNNTCGLLDRVSSASVA